MCYDYYTLYETQAIVCSQIIKKDLLLIAIYALKFIHGKLEKGKECHLWYVRQLMQACYKKQQQRKRIKEFFFK